MKNKSKYHFASFNYFELKLSEEVVKACSHSGACDADVQISLQIPQVKNQLDKIDPEKLKLELKEYGAWDENELSNHNDNLARILWIAAGNIQDEMYEAKTNQ